MRNGGCRGIYGKTSDDGLEAFGEDIWDFCPSLFTTLLNNRLMLDLYNGGLPVL